MKMYEQVMRIAFWLVCQDAAEWSGDSACHEPAAAFEHEGDDFGRYKEAVEFLRRRVWENVENVVISSLLRVPSEQILFENGLPSDTIVAAIRNVHPDLLVMGTVVRRGIPVCGLAIRPNKCRVKFSAPCWQSDEKTSHFCFHRNRAFDSANKVTMPHHTDSPPIARRPLQ